MATDTPQSNLMATGPFAGLRISEDVPTNTTAPQPGIPLSPAEMLAQGQETEAQGNAAVGQEYVQQGPKQVVQGAKDLVGRGNAPGDNTPHIGRGISRVIRGGMVTTAPVIASIAPIAAISAPFATAAELAVGTGAQIGVEKGAQALGASEENAQAAGDVAGLVVPGIATGLAHDYPRPEGSAFLPGSETGAVKVNNEPKTINAPELKGDSFNGLRVVEEPNTVYRARPEGQEGITTTQGSHAHATASEEEAHGYRQNLDEMSANKGENVKHKVDAINLNNIPKDEYEVRQGPNGNAWVKFTKDQSESIFNKAEEIAPKVENRPGGFDVTHKTGTLQIDQSTPTRATIKAVDVDESQQRQGIATKLYKQAKQELIDRGVTTLTGSLEGSGPVQLREKVFGPGNTKYFHGGEEISATEAKKIMDEDFGYVRAETTLKPETAESDQPVKPKERTTGDANLDARIKDAGGIPGGMQKGFDYKDKLTGEDKHYPDMAYVHHDSGSTLNFPMDASKEDIKAGLDNKTAEYKAAEKKGYSLERRYFI